MRNLSRRLDILQVANNVSEMWESGWQSPSAGPGPVNIRGGWLGGGDLFLIAVDGEMEG